MIFLHPQYRNIGHSQISGFNLVEAAIVLGVVGLIIGGIWVAAASVTQKNNWNKDNELILSGIEKTRSLFKNNLNLTSTSFVSSIAANMGIFPSSLMKGATAYSYSGYEMRLPLVVSSNNGIQFTFDYVDKAGCIWLLSKLASNSEVTYLWVMDESFSTFIDYSQDPADGATALLPVSASTIATDVGSFSSCGEIGASFKL